LVYLTTLSLAEAIGDLPYNVKWVIIIANNESERTWNMRPLPNSRYYPDSCFEGHETTVGVVGQRVKILPRDLLNTKDDCYALYRDARCYDVKLPLGARLAIS
jgi:hypothetical protein